ncbi:hypothetical protein [Streptomyces sp. NPDC057686]|uniref:hypothetical protein n=1 Tax=Streptomyces sp. NPDC057686 TaxID=3346212 RepID=UPI0036C1B8D2
MREVDFSSDPATSLAPSSSHLLGGQRAASFLDGVRQFVITNSAVITTVALLLLGAGILGDGLTGLGR